MIDRGYCCCSSRRTTVIFVLTFLFAFLAFTFHSAAKYVSKYDTRSIDALTFEAPRRRRDFKLVRATETHVIDDKKNIQESDQQGAADRCAWTQDKIVFSRCDLQILFKRLIARVPFMYAHFNDGELLAMKNEEGHTDRGMQKMSSDLKKYMTQAFHREAPGLIFGYPCVQEFRNDNEFANAELGNSTVERTIATLFINSNYMDARLLLLTYIRHNPDRGVHMVVSDNSDMTLFENKTGIHSTSVTKIPGWNAFPTGYNDNINNTQHHKPGDLVIICAGPLGRILAVEWFLQRPLTTYLELGSFFDYDLQGKSFGANYYDRDGSQPHCGETTQIQTSLLLELIESKPLI
jgi:hypothetical protein